MGTKVNTQVLADLLAEKAGISKRSADTFVKAFIQTTIDGGLSDGNVKIKGLGTFKIVKVADRESTNVNTGERILIAGYNKMSFVPDIDLDMQAAADAEAEKVAEVRKTVRKPAQKKTAGPVAAEEKTVAEKNAIVSEVPKIEEKTPVVSEPLPASPSPLKVAFESNKPLWYSIAIALLLIIVVFVVLLTGDSDKDRNEEQSEQVEAGVSDYQDTLSTESSATQSTESVEASQPQATGTHRVHVLQKGETLTTISLYYYHTPDSMRAIWKLNKFPNPNDIPIGTEILLP
ncbi:MAG: HU family DNA-binding protein [Bacteroidaceae bacterium]|nr:HU family DNA-binding protein [Bacteroidaceae bacterium]